ncbi:putative FMN-dependent luciferase-like monooxygenase [Rouxiella badensis]|jgi:putative FMN-dependent luciferase-like monooxygenase|uniref:Luciferase n=1 Tax=Rouxiella badensis TaxID=1646377 RepID=A0A1X0WHQ8_9GAMM|nr:putative FMN-dependent luciferase-like monooxygenase [Rouxiella badensis]MCC3703470.1 putative FMN-dependent luciferase-like monooxygenase [Rouxiella badensis]MCC3718408.1 putative FMN-dependent luciferase-like monooxygenase [Rouxiella badensis]MCC3726824.1 putative FMN-dependent luciferase-like monooxygenase [Rouxiella badensis]MCC3731893.1 putative FMN-dependent luciferase-like monooxygenase [Rouxiella badensis]MCC3738827.1 putative FMN-dependent luciferase-like monooxygenase [Rouxiella b
MSQAASDSSHKRLGFFTRLLDDTSPQERYRLAAEQIAHAEQLGFDSAWIAQHHFHRDEGGLPAPLVFLAYVAANTRHIRLGTGVITLAMENALRVAEDAAVLDLLAGGRLEIGLGSGGTASSFIPFGLTLDTRGEAFAQNLQTLRDAWQGKALKGEGNQLYPPAPQLNRRLWQATFSPEGGARAGAAGDGLMLSRTQPRPEGQPELPLDVLQNRIIDAYLEALPAGVEPRILGSRTAFVSDDAEEARRLAEKGLRRQAYNFQLAGHKTRGDSLDDYIAAFDVHLGTAEQVITSLKRDTALARVTDLAFQVHSIDPPHPYILRSIELIAKKVAPALGWVRQTPKSIAKPQPLHFELSKETL